MDMTSSAGFFCKHLINHEKLLKIICTSCTMYMCPSLSQKKEDRRDGTGTELIQFLAELAIFHQYNFQKSDENHQDYL